MKERAGLKPETLANIDLPLKLLPLLAVGYPGIAALLGQLTGDSVGNTRQLQEAISKVTKRLAGMDQQTKHDLVKQLISLFPEFEELATRK